MKIFPTSYSLMTPSRVYQTNPATSRNNASVLFGQVAHPQSVNKRALIRKVLPSMVRIEVNTYSVVDPVFFEHLPEIIDQKVRQGRLPPHARDQIGQIARQIMEWHFPNKSSRGTGFVINTDKGKRILTAAHVPTPEPTFKTIELDSRCSDGSTFIGPFIDVPLVPSPFGKITATQLSSGNILLKPQSFQVETVPLCNMGNQEDRSLLASSEIGDLCVMRAVDGHDTRLQEMPVLSLREQSGLEIKEPVFLLGKRQLGKSNIQSAPIDCIAKEHYGTMLEEGTYVFLQAGLSCRHGQSGSPVVDGNGDIVGIITDGIGDKKSGKYPAAQFTASESIRRQLEAWGYRLV